MRLSFDAKSFAIIYLFIICGCGATSSTFVYLELDLKPWTQLNVIARGAASGDLASFLFIVARTAICYTASFD